MRRNCILFLSILLTCVLVNAAAADTLQIAEAVYQNNGKVHLAWTDDAQRESYLVTSFCVEPNGGANVQIAQEKVTGTSCDVLALPGTTMAFAVSVEGAEASETTQVEIPVQPVRDFKVSGNVQLLRSLYEKTTRMNSFSAYELKDWVSGVLSGSVDSSVDSYLLRLNFAMPMLRTARLFDVVVTMEAPNGFVVDMMYEKQSEFNDLYTRVDWCYDIPVTYAMYQVYSNLGEIPTGKYTVRMFFDGLLATTSNFTIKQ